MPMCWRPPTCQRKDHFVKLAESLQKLTDQFAKFKALRFPTGMGRTKRKGFGDGRLSERKLRASNPGRLRMLTYLPANLSDAPALVVVLHGGFRQPPPMILAPAGPRLPTGTALRFSCPSSSARTTHSIASIGSCPKIASAEREKPFRFCK